MHNVEYKAELRDVEMARAACRVTVNVARMVQAFRQGLRDLLPLWELILSVDTLPQVLPLGLLDVEDFRFPTDVWVQVVYDFALAYHDKVVHREHLLKALTPHVPVRLIVRNAEAVDVVSEMVRSAGVPLENVEFHVQPTVDVWTRDCGPLFVSDGNSLELAEFAWANYGFPWPLTDPESMARGALDREVGERLGCSFRSSSIVAEGGGLEVNSRTLITYRDAMMQRNPGVELSEIESELKRLYGKEQVIWLDRAPITDRVLQGPKIANFFGWGANGHVDEYVRFVSEDTILVGVVSEEERERDALMKLDLAAGVDVQISLG